MSWQAASFAILAIALVAGFAWYEHVRPDSRVIALVATLAAFAALGRIAFAALPNVKPTTDIVLASGYALGGAPGFVVGAVAALSSNFFFGQGPWTPWQMFGWGLTGVIGAALAIVMRRRMHRVQVAIGCGIVGFGFTALQDFGDWVTYSDHSMRALDLYLARGVGFDLVHACGCVVFALTFLPALVRSLQRFAARVEITWEPIVPVGVAVLLAACALAPAPARAAGGPVGYLLSAQHRDGGFGASPHSSSSELYAGWAALGLAAAGHNPQDVRHGGRSALDYVRGGAISDPGSLERTILVIRAAGASASSFVSRLRTEVRADGSVSDQVNLTSFAILALRSAGVAPSGRTISWLVHQQDHDGGFNFATAGGASDIDDTGAALEAIAGVRSGSGSAARSRAVGFLRAHQNADGGFPAVPGGQSNAQSTAWAVQGLVAAGVNPASLHRGSALAFLQSLIGSDGHVHYSRTSDQTPVWVTGEALMALQRRSLPLAPVRRASSHQASAASGARRARASRGASTRSTQLAASLAASKGSLLAVNRLAVDAGVAAALALAPIGQ